MRSATAVSNASRVREFTQASLKQTGCAFCTEK
jgi:hypothetical protein